jgi:catechol 2,3-dioxygenase-like lactoylglutathione lyase family enzyme
MRKRNECSWAALCLTLACSSPRLAAQTAAPTVGEVVGIDNFGHIVSDLDKSFEFYRDLVGLEPAVTPGRFDPNPSIMKMGNTLGAQSHIGVLKVPGASFGVELIAYKDIDRKPASPRSQDPGAGNLILLVRDIDRALARLKNGGAKVVTLGGAALDIGNRTRGVFVKDPDGFFIGLVQRDPLPATTAPALSNIIGGLFAVTVEDTERTVRFYKDGLGFKPLMEFPFSGDQNRMALGATPGAQYRSTVLQIPGTSVSIEFPEFKDIGRTPLRTRVQDPGTALLQLEVRGVDALVKTLKAAGATVVSVGGEPVDVMVGTNTHLRIAIMRDPNNLFLELIQRMP